MSGNPKSNNQFAHVPFRPFRVAPRAHQQQTTITINFVDIWENVRIEGLQPRAVPATDGEASFFC